MNKYVNEDILNATAHLADPSAAREFELGHLHHDVPVEEAAWYAQVTFQGARIIADNHRSPTAAAFALADCSVGGTGCMEAPEALSGRCRKCGSGLEACTNCGEPALCGEPWCARCQPDGGWTSQPERKADQA